MKYLQSLLNREVFQSVRATSITVSSWLCTAGGFVADVLQPIAPFAFYLFTLCIGILVILAILYLLGKKQLLGSLVLASIACAATGLFTFIQQGDQESEDRGVVASALPAVASLQDRLGIIERKIDAIKDDTATIKASTERLESKSDAVLESLSSLSESIANASSGGIIPNPDTPEEHYHNARIHELGGDYSAARRSYIEYFKAGLPKLDPHLRFIAFLKVQEGTAGARETYNEISARFLSSASDYAKILLLNADQRKIRLNRYQSENPDFAPAPYHLSLDFSERRLGSQTISDKRQELAYLEAFQAADENGGLLRHFIDQELVTEWREDAEERLASLKSSDSFSPIENPVSISWMTNNSGINGNIQIAEPAKDIRWNILGQTEPQSTGLSGYNDPNTGQPAPKAFFTLPLSQEAATIEIRYTDLSGKEQGPFLFDFAPKRESDDSNRRILEMTAQNWLMFRDYEGQVYLYFTHLLSYRGVLSKIEYGIDTEKPDQVFDFPEWEKAGLAEIDGSFPLFLTVPHGTRFATVQLTYRDGSTSAVQRFERL